MSGRKFFVAAALSVSQAVGVLAVSAPVQETGEYERVISAYEDSLYVLRQRVDSLCTDTATRRGAADGNGAAATRRDGRYYRLFAPLTFYHSGIERELDIASADDEGSVEEAVDNALMHVYLRAPRHVLNNESRLREVGSVREGIDEPMRPDADFSVIAEPFIEEPAEETVVVMVTKPNFWTFGADASLQFTQNYFSDNWYKGGESSYSFLASATLTANYNNKQKIKFENTLELELGLQATESDTVNNFNTTSDLIRYTGKLGIQASKKWYYSLQLLAYTQFMRGTESNDETTYSDFMSPFTLNIGVGLDYTVDACKSKLTGSVNLSFFSFNFVYVDRDALTSDNGISGDHHTLEEFGSQITTSLTWKFNDNIKWQTRLYYFTDYESTLFEWENTLTLSINKYISAKIFIYPRFDDSDTTDGGWDYWQRKEYSSVGVSYSF